MTEQKKIRRGEVIKNLVQIKQFNEQLERASMMQIKPIALQQGRLVLETLKQLAQEIYDHE